MIQNLFINLDVNVRYEFCLLTARLFFEITFTRTSFFCSFEEIEHSMLIPVSRLLFLTVLPQQCSCLPVISLQPGARAKKTQCLWGRVLLQPSLLLLHSHFPEKLPGLLQLTGLCARQPQEVRGDAGCKPPHCPWDRSRAVMPFSNNGLSAVSVWPLTPCQPSAVFSERSCSPLTLFLSLLTARLLVSLYRSQETR